MNEAPALLSVRGLSVTYRGSRGVVRAVDDVSFSVPRGEIVGIVGESGSGKSTVSRAILGLLASPPAEITGGQVLFDDAGSEVDLLKLAPSEMRRIRGAGVGMVFQDPQRALNPVMRIGDLIGEGLRYRERLTRAELRARVLDVMTLTGIPDPERRMNVYPHELSGGLRQRALIASALITKPKLLLADEPTTALDVTIQAQILKLFERFRDELGMSVVLVTHDLGVVAQTCRRVIVMRAGHVVEQGLVDHVFASPTHTYTKALLAATRLERKRPQEAPDA